MGRSGIEKFSLDQLANCGRVEAERLIGLRALPPALREFCLLRRANPDVSLAALGQRCSPPASKSAMYHRFLRLQSLVDEKIAASADDTTSTTR